MCEFFGGKIVKHPDSSVEKDWQSCDIARNKCEGALHDLALRIGHTNMYQGYCRLSREAKSTNEVFLNHIDGVDNYVFYKGGAQMRADMAKVQAEEYLRNTFPKEGYIHCGTEVKKLEKPEVDPDFVMTCTVGSKQVDFVFADLTEGGKKRANTGVDAMQCIISGGTFNGESCRGPTKDECTKLDVALRAKGSTEGTYWDDGVRACILGNAMKTYKADVATNYIVGAVVIVGSALLVIGTDGLATPVVVENLALLAGDAGINYAIDWNHRRLSKAAANRFGDFIDDADKCTDEQCVLNVLKKHYATLSDVMNDLNKDDQATVDAVMDRLIGLIQTEFVACGKNDSGQTIYASPADCAMQTSTLRAIDYIDKASEPVLIIGSIIYNPGWVTSRFIKVKKVSKVAKDLNVTYKDAKQLIKAGDVVQDASGIAMRADDAARAAAYEEKLADAYKKYAPKNQSFDDFKKMFANEDEFDKQIEAWSSFEPGMVDVPITPRFTEEKYVPSPYSTYDPELAKQLKAIDSEYADDIAKLDAERDDLMHQKLEYEMERKRPFLEEDFKIREQAKEKLGHLPFGDDWDKPELQDLKLQMDDLKARMASAPVSPEEQAITLKREELQNLKEGYETARDYEKGKIIKATIPDDVADAVAETRRQELIDIIAEDDELFAQAENFSDLSDSEKQAFLQKIHSRLDEVTHVKGDRVTTFKDPKSSIVASAARQYNLTPLGTNLNLDEILETIVHEQSHLMDRDAQDLGMLGAQIAKEK